METSEESETTVDSTGFHSVIIQSSLFRESETGENYLSRSAWGPITFGGLVPTSEFVGRLSIEYPIRDSRDQTVSIIRRDK